MASSGKLEYGMDTSGSPSSRKLETTRLVGSIGCGTDVVPRSSRRGLARARRRYVKMVSMLLVVFAAAIVVFSALALTEASQTTLSTKDIPPTPHTILGFTYDDDGVTPINGAIVNITNTRTGETTQWNETRPSWDPDANVYSIDLSELPTAWILGDIINVTAWKDTEIGWNEGPITDNPFAYDQIDVNLNGTWVPPIPEFPMVILPVGGMLVLFAVVSLRRKEQ